MLTGLNVYRELTIQSVLFRLILAALFGGLIGIERGKKRRAAGFRTYMFVCMGAAMALLLGQYEQNMLNRMAGAFTDASAGRTDVCRFGAQVINGIGFLGAGTIIVTKKREVKGTTTAAGLWASACFGLAIGAGFYECIIPGFFYIFLCICLLPKAEELMLERTRHMNIYVEFSSLKQVGEIIKLLKSLGAHIYEVDIDRGDKGHLKHPHAVFSVRLLHRQSHLQILSEIVKMEKVYVIDEV